jgi:hypothetical protein
MEFTDSHTHSDSHSLLHSLLHSHSNLLPQLLHQSSSIIHHTIHTLSSSLQHTDDDLSDEEEESCKLISGPFATFIQLCLAFICILTLIIKRYQETPQREWSVWFFDVTKQGIGSSFGHFSNIYLSMIIATTVTSGDECQWYCLTYLIDCTLGIFLNIVMLKMFSYCVGHYGNGKLSVYCML